MSIIHNMQWTCRLPSETRPGCLRTCGTRKDATTPVLGMPKEIAELLLQELDKVSVNARMCSVSEESDKLFEVRIGWDLDNANYEKFFGIFDANRQLDVRYETGELFERPVNWRKPQEGQITR